MKQNFYFSQGILALMMAYSLEGSSLRTSSSWDVCDLHTPKADSASTQKKPEIPLHEELRHAIVFVKDDTTFTQDPAPHVCVHVSDETPPAPTLMSSDQRPRFSFIQGARIGGMAPAHLMPSHVMPPRLQKMDEETEEEEKSETLFGIFLGLLESTVGSAFGDNPPPDTPKEHTRF